MNIFPYRRTQHGRVRQLTASTLMVSLLLLNTLIVRAQQGDLKGESGRVVLVPNSTVDAKEIKFKSDRDHDGMTDDDETDNGTNPDDPSDADTDGDNDGLSNGDEVASGSNPNNADTDGDGVTDGVEASLGFNPSDPGNTPPSGGGTNAGFRITPAKVGLAINTILGAVPQQLTVTDTQPDGTVVDLTQAPGTTYQSMDESVALVDDFGTVVALAQGTTTIKAHNGEKTAECAVIVSTFTPGGIQVPPSTLAIPGYANDVAVSGKYVYIAAGAGGLQVVDATDRANPQIVASLATGGNANDVKVSGNFVYLADGPAGLQIIDVTDPLNPVISATLGSFYAHQVALAGGNRAYIATGNTLLIADVTDPAAPTILSDLFVGAAISVDASGDYAVVGGTGFNRGVKIINVSNGEQPALVGQLTLPYDALSIAIKGQQAYVATYIRGLQIVDFSVPSAPQIMSSIPDRFPSGNFGVNPRDVALFGNLAITADSRRNNSFPMISTLNPANPSILGIGGFSNTSTGSFVGVSVALDDQYVYMTTTSPFDSVQSNGTNGNTYLIVGQYQTKNDAGGVAPTVQITTPQNGDTLQEGLHLRVEASAIDDVRIAYVRFSVEEEPGMDQTDTVAPYDGIPYMVPGRPQLTIKATAVDTAGNESSTFVVVNVTPDPPPVVELTYPTESTQIIEGQTTVLSAEASDNTYIAQVAFVVNGEYAGTDSDSPYSLSYLVAEGTTSIVVEAIAYDSLFKTTTATRTISILPDPRTTVSGRVVDQASQPVANATVTVFSVHTAQTDATGAFAVTGVPTVRGNVVARVTGTINGQATGNSSLPKPPVSGGITDAGVVTLSTAPTAPTFMTGASLVCCSEQLIVGYPDRQSLVYEYFEGQFTPSQNFTLPFGAISSGAGSPNFTPDLFVQLSGQPGSILSVPLDYVQIQTPTSLASGLDRESDYIAAGRDTDTFPNRQVIAFLATSGTGGTSLKVRFKGPSDEDPPVDAHASLQNPTYEFSEPVSIAVDPGVHLRSLMLADVNLDRKVDLLAIKPVSGTDGRLVIFPRTSATSFGPPVETTVVIRSGSPTRGMLDLAFGSIGYSQSYVYVLGDDRISVYKVASSAPPVFDIAGRSQESGAAASTETSLTNVSFDREIVLPSGELPTGMSSGDINGDGLSDILVTTRSATAPESKSLLVYMRTWEGNFQPPTSRPYTAPTSAGDTRIAVGEWEGWESRDVVVVDGDKVIFFQDVGPITSGS